GYREINKPSLINDYNKYMGGVDRLDQVMSKDYRIAVSKSLLAEKIQSVNYNKPEAHFPAFYEDKTHKPDCIVCSDRKTGNRKQVKTYCKRCNQPMCIDKCFERYHTVQDYKIRY
ncbi:uncharacterized protein LOC126812607, partial [Patella vulgata]|uniref:uncharacterized protein LOC126812607 n=1 Tax=Patella vulgata TaxID=6465 RepID=UPI00217F7468